MKAFCRRKGIRLDYTVPYTPQQNGRAERLNRTVLNKARAMIFESGLKKEMWGEAIRVAAYILNRSPTDSLEVTPYQLWMNKIPDVSNCRVFGCEAYAKELGSLKKLDERSKRFVFVGYSPTGYRLWDASSRKIIVRRDVIFNEKRKETTQEEKKHVRELEEFDEEIRERTDEEEEEEENTQAQESSEEDDSYANTQETMQSSESEAEDEPADRPTLNQLRKSVRSKKKPLRYDEYVMLTYREAVEEPDGIKWKNAICKEKEALKDNSTWELVDREKVGNKRILSNKWVFRAKDDGTYKARLVIRGCEQKRGIDYTDTYSPVLDSASLRILFALIANRNYQYLKFDVKTAFLYGDLKEEIYMRPPEGFSFGNKVCKLKKALYGLKQAPLCWNNKFTLFLKQKGFRPLKTESTIWKNENKNLTVAFYVDDGLLLGQDVEKMKNFIMEMKSTFETK